MITHDWMSGIRRSAREASWGGLVIALMSVMVVVAMVAVAVLSRQSADLHRRAQLLAEQVRASTQELTALKWRANSEVLAGSADLSFGGPLVREGGQVISQLTDEVVRLQRLQPGADADRVHRDVQRLYVNGLEQLERARGGRHLSRATLAAMQSGFQPLLDRMDNDARRVAVHQQAVAAGALRWSLVASLGSLLLGLLALGALGWRLARQRRRAMLAEEVRAIERRSEQRLRRLVEHSSDVVTVLGPDLRVRWQAASVRRLLGVEPAALIDAPIISIVHPVDRGHFEDFLQARLDGERAATLRARLQHDDGHWCYVETIAENRLGDPVIEGLVLNMRDVSERMAFEDELRHQAFHDALTGLANRALFEDRLRHALAGRLRTRRTLAVLFLDVDDFKTINDSLGHGTGDSLLKAVAARIDSLVRPTDTAARLGGDEFAVLADGVDDDAEPHRIARRILDGLADPFDIDGRELCVSASIGIAVSHQAVSAEELLRNADMAMYAAKERGKYSIRAFEEAMHRRALERLEMRGELQRGLINDEFALEYQPIVALHGGRTVGLEALVRWQHPTRGLLPPDHFVGLAEETGLIVSLGQWILEQACVQARQWEVALGAPLYVSVNVSVRQLHEPDFPAAVAAVLERTGLEHDSLVLEITEGMLAADREAVIQRLRKLKRLGVRIAIDDFGTGYSSLSQLQQLPIDIVKVDKSFIDELHLDAQKANLVQGIINLGNSLQLDVVAEGIEHLEQANRLRTMDSPLGQGFLFSHPVAAESISAFLQTLTPLEPPQRSVTRPPGASSWNRHTSSESDTSSHERGRRAQRPALPRF